MVSIADVRLRHRNRQRELLKQYLHLLTVQRLAFEENDLDHAEETIRRERQILKDLEALANVHLPDLFGEEPLQEHPGDIADLYSRVRTLHRQNRELLARRSAETAREIGSLNIPPRRNSVYTTRYSSAAMLDVRG
jgi:hypothetical protein